MEVLEYSVSSSMIQSPEVGGGVWATLPRATTTNTARMAKRRMERVLILTGL